MYCSSAIAAYGENFADISFFDIAGICGHGKGCGHVERHRYRCGDQLKVPDVILVFCLYTCLYS